MTGTDRLFYGVPLTAETRQRIDAAIRTLPDTFPGRPAPAANWHITLRFLGPTSAAQRVGIETAVEAALLPAPFTIRFTGWGAFPRPSHARVLWIAVEDRDRGLARITGILETAARSEGFAGEDRPYRPHLTIARIRTPADLREILARIAPVSTEMTVDRITLYRSLLGSGPPRYEALSVIPLPA